MSLTCDVAVVGAGTAGLAAERAARKAGARTLLIDPAFTGTTCATVGCMPSKLLIAAADAAHGVREAGSFGIAATPRIDGPAVMARVRRMRDDFAGSVRQAIGRLPEGVAHRATARFTGPGRLALSDGETVEARAVVLATGARPAIPAPYHGLPHVLTSETVFEIPDLPARLGVIGAGPIGLELAQAFARLGSRVTLIATGHRLAGLQDGAVSDHLRDILAGEIELHLGASAEVVPDGDALRLSWDGGRATVDRLLVAAGRPPALEGLDLGAGGVDLDANGHPVVDPTTLRCGTAPVFLAGDANGDRPLLHEASDEGTIAGANAARFPEVRKADRSVPFALTFTRPETAEIGTVGAEGAVIGTADYTDQGRARVEGRNRGMVRLYATDRGVLTGASLCLPDGGHLAHLIASWVTEGASAAELLGRPMYHPTLEEGLTGALKQICRQCSLPPVWSRDSGPRPGFRGSADQGAPSRWPEA